MSKCLSDWNLLQNALKTNFKKIQKSKHLLQTTSLINTQNNNSKKNKELQINSTPYTFILLYCLLDHAKLIFCLASI